MSIKQQAKTNFIKYLEVYFDDKFNDFTIKRLERMLDEFDEALPKTFVADKASFDKGYKEGYGDAKKYYIKQINNDNNISSVLF
jgi:hypothetical protein